ncbi:unnamed protein product [Penicillium nalgiovense]|nr:unnamed protein product [Penicillium nalgiovense]
MFCLFCNTETKTIRAMDGSGRYPGNATLEQIKMDLNVGPDQTESIPKTSALAVTIPGAAAGWVDTVDRFGSGMLSLEQILAPAIELAEEGFPVSELSSSFASNRLNIDWRDHEHLRSASTNFKELLKVDPSFKDGVRGPSAGEIMKNLTLAQTFRALAADGKKGFYKGRVVEELVKVIQDLGGYLSLDGLKCHVETSTLMLQFKGQEVYKKQAPGTNNSTN